MSFTIFGGSCYMYGSTVVLDTPRYQTESDSHLCQQNQPTSICMFNYNANDQGVIFGKLKATSTHNTG